MFNNYMLTMLTDYGGNKRGLFERLGSQSNYIKNNYMWVREYRVCDGQVWKQKHILGFRRLRQEKGQV